MEPADELHAAAPAALDRERGLWWRFFGLLLLACGAWSLGVPLMTGPDESSHVVRAAAVVRGQFTGVPVPGFRNTMVHVGVPEAYGAAEFIGACYLGDPREEFPGYSTPEVDDCPEMHDRHGRAMARTTQHRGQPFYYLLGGVPTLLFRGGTGVYLMRLVEAGLCSALLASALVSILRLRGNLLVPLAAAVALSPAVLYFAGTVNSAGLEMAAAIGVWASGLALVASPTAPGRRLVIRLAVALILLVLSRGLSPAYAALALAVLAAVAGRARLRSLLALRSVRALLGATVIATGLSAAWLAFVQTRFPLPARPGSGLAAALDELPWDLREMVAVFGWTDVVPPVAVHLLWLAATAAVFALAWRAGGSFEVALGAGVAVAAVALLISGEGFSIPDTGFWWQGRYVMPLALGAPLVAAAGARKLDRGGRAGHPRAAGAAAAPPAGEAEPTRAAAAPPAERPGLDPLLRRLVPALLAVLAALHVWCFLYALRHYTVGHTGPANPVEFLFDPRWSPPLLPPAVWAVALASGVGGTAALLWRSAAATVRAAPPAARAGQPATRPDRAWAEA